jgi:U4/U6 small nuclear ribonucleoprotein SNU13
MKTLNRGVSELIVLAADAQPLETVLHLPVLCEDKVFSYVLHLLPFVLSNQLQYATQNVSYIFVPSQAALRHACNVSKSVIAACVTTSDSKELQSRIDAIKIAIEKLLV